MAILIFFLVLFVLILVHEWGHFIVAKKTGMRVDEFGIGFPPKLFGIKKGETEYTFNALPIGGFVKIWGEDAVEVQGAADYNRSFAAKNKWAQAAVLIAGVTMNVLLAWFLFSVVFALGVPTAIEESNATDASQLIVSDVLPGSPAEEAGIPVGAVITGVHTEGGAVDTLLPSTFSAFTAEHENVAMEVAYSVGGEAETVSITPQSGVLESNVDQVALGVALALVETVRSPIHIAVYDGLKTTINGLGAITAGLSTLIYDSVRGQADFSQVAGPVGIVGLVGDAAEFGLTSLLMFTAFISLNLAIINLLPFPALDGGRLVFVAIEAITRRPINPVWAARTNFVGFALLMLLMVAITISDVSKIL